MKRIEDDDLPSSDFRLRLTPARRAGKAGEDDFSPMGGALGCTGRKDARYTNDKFQFSRVVALHRRVFKRKFL